MLQEHEYETLLIYDNGTVEKAIVPPTLYILRLNALIRIMTMKELE